MMNRNEKVYEPPKMKVYQFDDNDQILTASGGDNTGGDVTPTADYAANALNKYINGTSTTIEK